MPNPILICLYVVGGSYYINNIGDYPEPFISMLAFWAGTAVAVGLWVLLVLLYRFLTSPKTQGCTPEGGVRADGSDDNSTGGVTTPEAAVSASGASSKGGAHE